MGYGTWLHGEAVGAGMVLAARLSERVLGLAPETRRVSSRSCVRVHVPVDAAADSGRSLARADGARQEGDGRPAAADPARSARPRAHRRRCARGGARRAAGLNGRDATRLADLRIAVPSAPARCGPDTAGSRWSPSRADRRMTTRNGSDTAARSARPAARSDAASSGAPDHARLLWHRVRARRALGRPMSEPSPPLHDDPLHRRPPASAGPQRARHTARNASVGFNARAKRIASSALTELTAHRVTARCGPGAAGGRCRSRRRPAHDDPLHRRPSDARSARPAARQAPRKQCERRFQRTSETHREKRLDRTHSTPRHARCGPGAAGGRCRSRRRPAA